MHQDPETPQRLGQNCVECLLWRYGSAVACCRGRGSGCSRPGYGLLEEVAINPTIELPDLYRTGDTDSWRAQTEPGAHQDPGERSRDPTRDWLRLAQECPEVSGRGVGQWWPATGLRAWNAAVHAQDLLKEVTIIFITSTIDCSQVKQQQGNSPAHQQKTGLKISWTYPSNAEEAELNESMKTYKTF